MQNYEWKLRLAMEIVYNKYEILFKISGLDDFLVEDIVIESNLVFSLLLV